MPAAVGDHGEEMSVLLVAGVSTEHTSSREVVWAIFADGHIKGYQVPSKAGNALRPTGSLDEQGNMHICWLNSGGFGRYDVYYASTADSVKADLDRVTMQDRGMSLLNSLWNLAPALGFFPPIFLLWTITSFVWVVGFYFVKVEGGLDRRASQVALVVAILIYLFSKLFLVPAVLFYAPFWDRLPANLQFISVLGTPLFTLLVALGAVYLYLRRSQFKSLFPAYLIFVITDSLLSLIIYIPTWLAR